MPEVLHLQHKLQRLYARNAACAASEVLAARLGVKPVSVRQWIHVANVPLRHLAAMARIYRLHDGWLLLESCDEFDAVLAAHPFDTYTAWQQLLAEARTSHALREYVQKCGRSTRRLSSTPRGDSHTFAHTRESSALARVRSRKE